MGRRELLYLESDGQVYLVKGPDGRWTFPTLATKLPFAYDARHDAVVLGDRVVFARPRLDHWPKEWTFKDDVPSMPSVDPVVQKAINASLARCVAGTIVVRGDGQILLVKSNRGFTKGMWNMPGGFIEYGEEPEAAAVRETKEETGLDIRVKGLLGVYMKRFESAYFMYGFVYEAEPLTTEIRTDPAEIETYAWMEPKRAMKETRNPFAKAALKERFGL